MGPVPALILLSFAFLLGLAIDQGTRFWQPLRAEAAPDAPWFAAPAGGERLYLRARIVLPAAPARAYLQVVAAGAFGVYTNGQRRGGELFASPYTGEVFDLTRSLRAGENVIGISVQYDRRAGAAHVQPLLLVQTSSTAPLIPWPTSWRARNRFPRGEGGVEWYAPDYADTDWTMAIPTRADSQQPVVWVGPSLVTLKALPSDCWIWSSEPTARAAVFARRLQLDEIRLHDAWLGIDVDGGYRLRVNGITVQAAKGVAGRIDLYQIARYLKPGDNAIEVAVRDVASPGRVCVAGVVSSVSGVRLIKGDSGWSVGAEGSPAVAMLVLPASPQSVSAQDLGPNLAARMVQGLRPLAYAAAILALVMLAGVLFEICYIWNGGEMVDAWRRFSQPFAVAALVLGAMQIAAADPRLAVEVPALLGPYYLAGGGVVLLGWLAIEAFGCIRQTPRKGRE
jgi:hypothetical protein